MSPARCKRKTPWSPVLEEPITCRKQK